MPDFLLPDLGEGLDEAVVVAWHVAVGDTVAVDQVVVEVETAKATVEVPIPYAGEVSALHAGTGQSVRVGAPLISVGSPAEAVGSREPSGFREPGVEGASGNVLIGYGTAADAPRGRRQTVVRPVPDEPAASAVVPVISPIVRKLARDRGVDLRTVEGTGPNGLVLRHNVEQALASPTVAEDDVTRIPLTGTRKAVADKLTRSRREIPEATVWVDVDATDLLAARAALNADSAKPPVSVLALVARFALLGLRRHPELNGRIEGDEIVLPRAVNLGLAAQTNRGLMVPVVHDAHELTTRELAVAIGSVTAEARAGSVRPAQLTGGTFTVNNYGVFGVDGSAAIINHPEIAILGIGRIVERPWVVGGSLAVRKVSQLTLAFDHRACDGGTAGGFLRFVADCVESPISVLGDL